MPTIEELIAVVGTPVDSVAVRLLIASDGLIASAEPDLEEGEPQRAYLSAHSAGYQLMHCGREILTAFVYVEAAEGFQTFSGPLLGGLPDHATRQAVLERFGLPSKSGTAVTIAGLGRQGAWDRFDIGRVCIHFQYTESDERVRLLSVMLPCNAP